MYEALGLPRTATKEDISRAYRQLALKHHPDKGGNPEDFKRITEAHSVLSNPSLRAAYDAGGEEALAEGPGPGAPPFPRTSFRPIEEEVTLTLEEAARGKDHAVMVSRMAKDGGPGAGRREVARVQVHIPKGVPDGCVIVREGEGHMGQGAVVVKVNVAPKMGAFERHGVSGVTYDLAISLWEALVGDCVVKVPMVEDMARVLHVRLPDRILKPGEVFEVPGRGMPMFNTPGSDRGPLLLVLRVLFPDSLPKAIALNIAQQVGAPLPAEEDEGQDLRACAAPGPRGDGGDGGDGDLPPALETTAVDADGFARREETVKRNLEAFIEEQTGALGGGLGGPGIGIGVGMHAQTVQCAQS
jgi:DnaJ family protein A protein 2